MKALQNIFILLFFCCFILIGKQQRLKNDTLNFSGTTIVSSQNFPACYHHNDFLLWGTLLDESLEDLNIEADVIRRRTIFRSAQIKYSLTFHSSDCSNFHHSLLQLYTDLPPPVFNL